MKTQNLIFIAISPLALFLILHCNSASNSDDTTNQNSFPVQITVQLSPLEKAGLNNFFTLFSEIYLPTFSMDNVPDSVLIQFGVYYNYRKHFKIFKQITEGSKASIDKTQVADTAFRYFNQTVKKHQSIVGIDFNNNNYTIYNSDGEVYRFSQILELIDLGGGIYQATIEIFNASSGFTGDINANPQQWKSVNEGQDVPHSEGKMKAKIRKVEEKGIISYVLLEYLNL